MRPSLPAGLVLLALVPAARAQSLVPATTPLVTVAADPAAVAEAWLRSSSLPSGSTFERRLSLPVASGTVVRFVQRHEGVLVRDGGWTVLVSPAGVVLAVNDFSARGLPSTVAPVWTVQDAAVRARQLIGGVDPGDDVARTFFVWTREFGAPRTVFECDLQAAVEGTMDAPRVLLDPQTGRVLLRANRAVHFSGQVYPQNPNVTPNRIDVPLTGLAAGSAVLEGDDVRAYTCIDTGAITSFSGVRAHLCSGEHRAIPDTDGRYAPSVADPLDPTGAYGELSMYFHTAGYLQFMRGLGFTNFRTRPMNVYANVRFPWADSEFGDPNADLTGPLLSWDNAAFIPGSPPNALTSRYGRGKDVVMFGLGSRTNFAYDGDVVAHEDGHAVVAATADFEHEFQDRWGTNASPAALNEGMADYFSCARAGDPDVGEYAGEVYGSTEVRTLTSQARYPDSINGESHNDSLPTSAALWTIRTQSGPNFDRAVYEALAMSSSTPSHFSFATDVVAAVQRLLGPTAASTASAEFTRRGVLVDAPRVRSYRATGSHVSLPGHGFSPLAYVPSYFQLRFPMPARTDRVHVDISVLQPGATALLLHVLGHVGGPVEYDYPNPDTIHANAELEDSVEENVSHRVITDLRLTPRETATDLYLSLAAEDGGDTVLMVRLTASVAPAPGADAAVPTETDAGTGPTTDEPEKKSCGCRTAGADPVHAAGTKGLLATFLSLWAATARTRSGRRTRR